jgi:hypothetical protein
MDPVAVGAVILAVATGVSEALGSQLWTGVVSLVHRPLQGGREPTGAAPTAESGEAELIAFQGSLGDQGKAVALAGVLLARADDDPGFERALSEWWEQAAPVREKTGNVTNTISGGTFSGPVLQGRNFTGLTFGAAPARSASLPGDSDVR